MGVRNIGTDDFPEGALAEFFFHVFTEFLNSSHEGLIICIVEVVDFVDLYFWDNESVALGLRIDIEEGKGFVILVDFVAGDFTVYDFCEDAWHFSCSF